MRVVGIAYLLQPIKTVLHFPAKETVYSIIPYSMLQYLVLMQSK